LNYRNRPSISWKSEVEAAEVQSDRCCIDRDCGIYTTLFWRSEIRSLDSHLGGRIQRVLFFATHRCVLSYHYVINVSLKAGYCSGGYHGILCTKDYGRHQL